MDDRSRALEYLLRLEQNRGDGQGKREGGEEG